MKSQWRLSLILLFFSCFAYTLYFFLGEKTWHRSIYEHWTKSLAGTDYPYSIVLLLLASVSFSYVFFRKLRLVFSREKWC